MAITRGNGRSKKKLTDELHRTSSIKRLLADKSNVEFSTLIINNETAKITNEPSSFQL